MRILYHISSYNYIFKLKNHILFFIILLCTSQCITSKILNKSDTEIVNKINQNATLIQAFQKEYQIILRIQDSKGKILSTTLALPKEFIKRNSSLQIKKIEDGNFYLIGKKVMIEAPQLSPNKIVISSKVNIGDLKNVSISENQKFIYFQGSSGKQVFEGHKRDKYIAFYLRTDTEKLLSNNKFYLLNFSNIRKAHVTVAFPTIVYYNSPKYLITGFGDKNAILHITMDEITQKEPDRAYYNLLLPVSIIADIVTSPLQLIWVIYKVDGKCVGPLGQVIIDYDFYSSNGNTSKS